MFLSTCKTFVFCSLVFLISQHVSHYVVVVGVGGGGGGGWSVGWFVMNHVFLLWSFL